MLLRGTGGTGGTDDLVGWSRQNGASLPVVAIPSANLRIWRVRRDVERCWLTLMCRLGLGDNPHQACDRGDPDPIS
jgi:hypothetical protein